MASRPRHTSPLPSEAVPVPDVTAEKGNVKALVRALIDEARSTVRLFPTSAALAVVAMPAQSQGIGLMLTL